MALSKAAIKDISDAGYKSGASLWRLYGDKGNDVVDREAKRVHAELSEMMVTMYGNPHHTGQFILRSMMMGYQDAMNEAAQVQP